MLPETVKKIKMVIMEITENGKYGFSDDNLMDELFKRKDEFPELSHNKDVLRPQIQLIMYEEMMERVPQPRKAESRIFRKDRVKRTLSPETLAAIRADVKVWVKGGTTQGSALITKINQAMKEGKYPQITEMKQAFGPDITTGLIGQAIMGIVWEETCGTSPST